MKKGDIINISTRHGVKQVEIISIGSKYITTTNKYKFHKDTLREVDGVGISAYIIPDLDKYYKNLKRKQDEFNVEIFFKKDKAKNLTDEDLEEILKILNKYNK